ncbi:MAG: hypothetical protein J6Q47_03840, partial [Paludibacteraceae bacterium]|nr:hypothetical protein [Paludibacteraceae bacterium]
EDYKFLMPLPVKKFFFVKYIAQPPFCQQLGIFSASEIDKDVVRKFQQKIPYPVLTYSFNEWNFVEKSRQNPNFVLDLSLSKEELFNRFSKNTWRNIAKARKHNLTLDYELSEKDFFDFFRENDKKIGSRFEKQMSVFRGRCYGVRNPWGRLVAAVFCLETKNRLIYLAPVSSEEGKNSSAMFLLVYSLIDFYSDIILDFEGSRIEGIARFYKGFGAEKRTYYTIGYAK